MLLYYGILQFFGRGSPTQQQKGWKTLIKNNLQCYTFFFREF